MYNLAIIGSGPAGYVAAERAGSAGLKVVLFEKKELGGVCLNEGCIPTKTLLHSAKLLDYAKTSDKYGINIAEANIDYAKTLTRKEKVRKKLVGAIKVAMRNAGVEVVNGEAQLTGGCDGDFTVTANGEEFHSEKLLICTGSETFTPQIDWLEPVKDKIITSREALELDTVPDTLAIVGGGVIGMEFASLFTSLGSKVCVYELQPEILGVIDGDIAEMLRKSYEAKGVKFYLGGNLEGIEPVLNAEKILLCVGRRASLGGLDIESIDLKANSRGALETDEFMQTAVKGVYAAGDITGKYMLAHCASREGEVAVAHILRQEDRMSYRAVPSVVYTSPEVACTGLSEAQARTSGQDVAVRSLPMAYSGRFVAENERGNGLCKIVYDKQSGAVLGVQMIGGPCSEIIASCCIAIEKGLTVSDLQKIIFPHPSVSEIIKETSWSEDIESK